LISLIITAAILRIGLPIYRQQVAIASIEAIGGSVDFELALPPVRWLYAIISPVTTQLGIPRDELKTYLLRNFRVVDKVHFGTDSETFYKRGPRRFTGPGSLFDGPTVNDDNLAAIVDLPGLKVLDLDCSNISDVGIQCVKELTALEELNLDGADVSDACIDDLQRLTQLRRLSLNRTQITDAGLEKLRGMDQLLELFISDTKVSASGVESLQRALPKLEVRAGVTD
jgi:hypothetical protein